MAYPIRSDTVLLDIYLKVAHCIVDDPGIQKLLDGVVVDFDFLDSDVEESYSPPPPDRPRPSIPQPVSKPKTMPPFEGSYQPSSPPRIYLLPTNIEYPRMSSCNNQLEVGLQIVLDGFSVKSVQFHRLVFRLAQLIRNIPFSQLQEDGHCFNVVCDLGSGSFEFDSERQVMTHSLNMSVRVYL